MDHITKEYIEKHGEENTTKEILFSKIYEYSVLKGFNKLMDLTFNDIDLGFLDGWFYIKASDFFMFSGFKEGFAPPEFMMSITIGLNINFLLKRNDEYFITLPFIEALIIFAQKEYVPEEVDFESKTYLMKDENTGYTKIGKSINPRIREKTLQSEKPTISLFAICDHNIEKFLHKKFEDKRIRGEWFNLSDDNILDIINEYGFIQVNILADSLNFTKSIQP